mgnify:CR=1 FL=1
MSSSPSSAPSFSLSLSLRARVLSARSLLAFSMRRAPLFRSFSFQASSSSSSLELLSLFSFFVSVLARREEGAFQVFLLSPKDSHKFIPLSPSCRERKKDKKGQRQTQRRRRSLFLRVGQTKKRTKKQEGKKDRITPPPKRDYTYPKVRYYRHKSSSRSVAGAKTRKRRLFSGGVDFFAGFNRARL